MLIKSISLTNFRNHNQYYLECNPDTTLILGENGCGKTSVLEAIYILTRGKSFRATDPDIIKREAPFYRIELTYDNGETRVATYNHQVKTFICFDKKSRRLPKKAKHPVVLFQPSDLNLVSGSPSRHREYFDHIFSELSEEYSINLSKYEKALHQRNELLKSDNLSRDALFSWNLLLARYGSNLHKMRQEFIIFINENLNPFYTSIAENHDLVFLKHKTELKNITESAYLKFLEQNFEKDHYLGHTSFGIHRDDFEFFFNANPASGSASRGETRSLILALKFVEAKILEEKLGEKPIILLDDVFSELDNLRRKCLINNFKDHQVILTSVEAVTY